MIQRMTASEYIRFLKSAKMLFAERRLTDIEDISFPHYKKDETRSQVMRAVTRASKEFLSEGMTDFKNFAANVARRLMIGGGDNG